MNIPQEIIVKYLFNWKNEYVVLWFHIVFSHENQSYIYCPKLKPIPSQKMFAYSSYKILKKGLPMGFGLKLGNCNKYKK